MSHTPGPWRTAGSRDRQVFAADGCIADCAQQWADDDDDEGLEADDLRAQANASLIALAPEMLDILRDFVSDYPNINQATVNEAKRLIEKVSQ